MGFVFFQTIKHFTMRWNKEDYSYCYLMPLVILYIIWEKRNLIKKIPSIPTWFGFITFAFGISLFWLGELGGEYFTLYLAFWFTLIGILWIHIGWEKIKALAFPLLMILTMFPLPDFLYRKTSVKLQLISSQLGVKALQLYGMSAYREGNVIDIGFTQLQVVDACSGLRYIIPLLILSILLAYFFKDRLWKRIILVISSIPISIVMNSMRIAFTGILYELWGARVAEGFFHGFSGWLIFICALAIMLGEIWILKKISPRPRVVGKIEIQNPKLITYESPTSKSPLHTLFSPPQFIVAVIILAGTFALSHGIEFREKTPIVRPLNQFPLGINEWVGKNDILEQKFIDELDLSDYVIVDYKNRDGRLVNLYVAYYESQRKGESIHSPETCLPGTGWEFQEAGTTLIPTGDGKAVKVNRAFMVKPGQRELVYFWFPMRGRILTNAYQLKIYTFWDALTRQRTDGALVRLITPVYQNEDLKEAEIRLQGFTREVIPILANFLPE